MPLRVVLVGAESAAMKVLGVLLDSGQDVVAVLVERPDTLGAGLGRRAEQLGLRQLPIERVTEPAFAPWMAAESVDLLLNVHSLSIIHPDVAGAPRIGSFNLHPGPLPSYSGLNTVTWAIASGERQHAVTVHWIEAGVDTGRIAYCEHFPIGDHDTGFSVFSTCVRLGLGLIGSLLETAQRDPAAIPARPQVGRRTVYRRRDIPRAGRIEWARSARQVHDLARASDFGPFPSPCGHPVAMLGSVPVEIVGTGLTHRPCPTTRPGMIGRSDDGRPVVATGDEWLAVTKILVEGRAVAVDEVLDPGRVLTDGPPR